MNPELNEREHHVMTLVCHGLTNPEIAKRLWVTPDTMKSMMRTICRKLGARNRTVAVFLYILRYNHSHPVMYDPTLITSS